MCVWERDREISSEQLTGHLETASFGGEVNRECEKEIRLKHKTILWQREREREREIDSVSSHSKSHAICNRLNASVRSLSRPLLTDSLLPMSHEKFSAV